MIGMKKRVSIFAAVALAIAMASPMMGTPAYAAKCSPAKNKTKGCKNEIKGCTGNFACSTVKGKARKQCKKNCKTAYVKACKANESLCTASPSGAFLE